MKSFVLSKTIWVNALALVVAVSQHYSGPLPTVDPTAYAVAMAGINIVLRFVTKTPIAAALPAQAQ
jgi:hypothetical protein